MSNLTTQGHFIEDLEVGMSASFSKTITEADIIMFAGVSGDFNPVHINEEYAAKTQFRGRIAHGSLTAALVSTVLGMKLPGPGAIFLKQESTFKAPVRIGDTVVASVEVIEIFKEKRRVRLKTQCTVSGAAVLEGAALVLVNSRTRSEVSSTE